MFKNHVIFKSILLVKPLDKFSPDFTWRFLSKLTICSNGSTHLKKMAAIPINVKKKKRLKMCFSRTKKTLRLNLGNQHWELRVYHICSDDGPRMTQDLFDLFITRSNLRPHKNVEKSFFLKCIQDLWLKLTMYDEISKPC